MCSTGVDFPKARWQLDSLAVCVNTVTLHPCIVYLLSGVCAVLASIYLYKFGSFVLCV